MQSRTAHAILAYTVIFALTLGGAFFSDSPEQDYRDDQNECLAMYGVECEGNTASDYGPWKGLRFMIGFFYALAAMILTHYLLPKVTMSRAIHHSLSQQPKLIQLFLAWMVYMVMYDVLH